MAPFRLNLLPLFFFFLFSFSAIYVSLAQVPPNETFYFVNNGEFGEVIIEYDANFRVIRNGTHTFYDYPFRLCFYNTTPDAFIFAIRAGLPRDESLMRWVWDANRHDPVRENATINFQRDGNLVLADVDGRVVWQTNTANKGVVKMRMLNNGNLVLLNRKGNFVWQSFDYPTDTLLVGQSLRIGSPNKVVSRKSDADPSDGIYSMILDNTGLKMYINNSGQLLLYGGWPFELGSSVTFDAVPENDNATAYELILRYPVPVPAASEPGNRRRLLQVRPIGSGGTRNLNKINYNGTLSFLRLSVDGNLRAFTYYPPVGYLKWAETFAFFSADFIRSCGLPSFCGSYGLCDKGMCVACPSPKGLLGWSESCAPPKLPACRAGGGGSTKYYKIVGAEHFSNTYLDNGEGPLKVEACREKCNKDCKCLGFIYKEDLFRCLLIPYMGTLIKDVNATSVAYIKY